MTMSMSISPHVNVRHCSQCQADTEYHCRTCGLNLCPSCKRTHNLSLNTKLHCVTLYREQFCSFYKNEMCSTHPTQIYQMHCETCDIPVCFSCTEHKQHKLQNIRTAFENKRKHNEKIIMKIRSETLYSTKVVQAELRSEVTTFPKDIFFYQLHKILTKSQKLKCSLDSIQIELRMKYDKLMIRYSFKQMIKMMRHVVKIQIHEQRCEETANRPVHFLRFIQRAHLHERLILPQIIFSLSEKTNIEILKKLLSEINITERGKRPTGNEVLLTLLPIPVLQTSFVMKDVHGNCDHIS